MSITPNFVPREYKTLNIVLLVKDAEEALKFYNRAFGAEITMKLKDAGGVVQHAEMRIEDTVIMLKDSAESTHNNGVILKLYTGDVSAFMEVAVGAGCEEVSPIKKEINGDRSGKIKDPFGHQWIISTHVEDITAKELQRRFNESQPKSTSPQ
jgi:PhnB protein